MFWLSGLILLQSKKDYKSELIFKISRCKLSSVKEYFYPLLTSNLGINNQTRKGEQESSTVSSLTVREFRGITVATPEGMERGGFTLSWGNQFSINIKGDYASKWSVAEIFICHPFSKPEGKRLEKGTSFGCLHTHYESLLRIIFNDNPKVNNTTKCDTWNVTELNSKFLCIIYTHTFNWEITVSCELLWKIRMLLERKHWDREKGIEQLSCHLITF